MKINTYLLTLALFFNTAIAQQAPAVKTPTAVKTALKSKFPAAANVNWSQQKDIYIAEFTNGTAKTKAFYDKAGTLTETQTAISKDKLPEPVNVTVGAEFKDFKNVDNASIDRVNSEKLYKVVVEKPHETVELELNNEGTIMKTTRNPK